MRKLILIGTTVAALLIGSAAPVLGAHGANGCPTASGKVAGKPAAAAVGAACARGN